MCTMSIDATKAVARVLITEATSIGVLWNQYDPTQWITIPEGMNQQITIYNGRENGPDAFVVIFTRANYLRLSLISLTAFLMAYVSF